jgi:hypothetical protein
MMNQKDFDEVVRETVTATAELLIAKGREYAGGGDRLANFKRGASLTGTTPLQVLFVYMSKHYDSLANYVKKDAEGFEQKLSEPIEGRLHDLINYCLLAKALIKEKGKVHQQYGWSDAVMPATLDAAMDILYQNISKETIEATKQAAASYFDKDGAKERLIASIEKNNELLRRLRGSIGGAAAGSSELLFDNPKFLDVSDFSVGSLPIKSAEDTITNKAQSPDTNAF